MRIRYFHAVVALSFVSLCLPLGAAEKASPTATPPKKSEKLVRREAVLAWAESKSVLNAPSLLEALSDKDALVREMAVRGLKELGWSPAAPQISNLLLKDPAFEVREESARALRRFKDVSHVPVLLQAAADPHPAVRVISLESAADFPSPDVTQALIKSAKDPLPEVRRTVMSLLGKQNDPSAMPTLLSALKDPDPAVRANAAQDIGTFAKKNMPAELQKLLADPDDIVRTSAARSLLMAGDFSGYDVIKRALNSQDRTARLIAINAMGYTQDSAAKVQLAEISANDPDVYIQQEAKMSLQRMAQRKVQ